VQADDLAVVGLQRGLHRANLGAQQHGAVFLQRNLRLHRHALAGLFHGIECSGYSDLGLQNVLASLNQQDVHPAVNQAKHLIEVRLPHRVKADVSQRGKFCSRPNRSGDVARPGRRGEIGRHFARDLHRPLVDLMHLIGEIKFPQHNAAGAEGVRLHHVSARLEVGSMDVFNNVGPALNQHFQQRNPSLDDFWGKENCSEVLVLSRPDIIKDIHAAYFKAGADVVETNTFGASSIVLGEFDLADKVHEINKRAVEIAREVAADFTTPARPRYVAGSIGPGTKLPSLGHIGFDAMWKAYFDQVLGLIDGGVDILLIETCQDILQTKIAIAAAFDAMKQAGKRVPVQAQVTLQENGAMLVGTEIG